MFDETRVLGFLFCCCFVLNVNWTHGRTTQKQQNQISSQKSLFGVWCVKKNKKKTLEFYTETQRLTCLFGFEAESPVPSQQTARLMVNSVVCWNANWSVSNLFWVTQILNCNTNRWNKKQKFWRLTNLNWSKWFVQFRICNNEMMIQTAIEKGVCFLSFAVTFIKDTFIYFITCAAFCYSQHR